MDCIVNVTQNWGIGKDGDLLVSIPTDLRRFRALTTGKTVITTFPTEATVAIYGRKTLLTFPHACPLPNRENRLPTGRFPDRAPRCRHRRELDLGRPLPL